MFEEEFIMNNKEKVAALIKSIETGAHEPVGYINPNRYIQHNLAVGDGLAGFGAVLHALPPNSAKADCVRVFQDGDYVFAHTEYDFFGPKAGFDIFRFEEGLIVEHWDNLQEITGPNPSGHTMFDGKTETGDIEKTDLNKALVKGFIQDVLIGGSYDKLKDYISSESYIQHNPSVADGLSGLSAAMKAMAEHGIDMKFDKIHKVLGEGNFVMSVCEGTFAGRHTSFYDLFRVESNKIVEHWDVMEPIIPKADWKNNNGKF